MKRSLVVLFPVVVSLLLCLPSGRAAEEGEAPPKVVSTNPLNGAFDVDPSLSKITVTFSKPMLDKSWSWSYEERDSFPRISGQPYYTDDGKTCVLPVTLEPGRSYVVWINTARFKNFMDRSGRAAAPHKLVFTTGKK